MSTIAITVKQGVATWSADTVDALSGFHDSKVGVSPPKPGGSEALWILAHGICPVTPAHLQDSFE